VADHLLTQDNASRLLLENGTDLLITEYDFGTGGSVVTLYCNDGIVSGGNAGTLQTSQPTASTSTTGWTVGGAANNTFSRQTYNAEVPGANFTSTSQPSGAPVNSAQDCWRYGPSTGTFSAGTWYSSLSVIAVTSGGVQDGRARFRLWRSDNADGTGATELTPSVMVGSLVTNVSTTVAQSSSASMELSGFTMNNGYIFMQVAWERLG